MTDKASRSQHLTDMALLTIFNTHFPQLWPWILCHPNSRTISAPILALRRKRSKPTLWTRDQLTPKPIGKCGWTSVPHTPWTIGSPKGTTLFRTYKCLPCSTLMDALHSADGPCNLTQLTMSHKTLGRRMPGWAPETHDLCQVVLRVPHQLYAPDTWMGCPCIQ